MLTDHIKVFVLWFFVTGYLLPLCVICLLYCLIVMYLYLHRMPASHSRTPAPHSRTPAPHSRTPAPHSRTPAPHSRTPVTNRQDNNKNTKSQAKDKTAHVLKVIRTAFTKFQTVLKLAGIGSEPPLPYQAKKCSLSKCYCSLSKDSE